ncbi:MAG: SGNH/GDSL hydrolase family protein [Candidatus Zixiibacteriota bacterium]|nr:MAG: SGNH/GDSL hydrolase family protein [candidate division Zixibacteria bacterium]
MKNSSETPQMSTFSRGKRTWFIILMVILAIILMEAGLRLVHFVTHLGEKEVPDSKMLLSPYKDKPWAEQYWTEMHQREIRYEPYYGWSLKEFNGQYVNIDSNGLRQTFNPVFSDSEPPETLFVFGGSTIWGGGSRDDYTIPSWLSRLLNEKGHPIFVVNYGTTGHVFTQEVIRLMMALRAGHRPDYVVFYDGTNEVYSAYQAGVAGTFQNVERTRERLRQVDAYEHVSIGLGEILRDNSMIYRAVRKFVSFFTGSPDRREAAAEYTDQDLRRLAGEIRRAYAESAQLLDYLAKKYDFEYICFWQPVAFLEDSLGQEERNSDKRINDRSLAALFAYAHDSVSANPTPRSSDITDALANRSGSVYVDFCHITEDGNKTVASRMASIIEKELLGHEQTGDN